MTFKKELIKKLNLRKLPTRAYFYDGRVEKNRALYVTPFGTLLVWYNYDLHIYKPYGTYNYTQSAVEGKLGAGYSWFG